MDAIICAEEQVSQPSVERHAANSVEYRQLGLYWPRSVTAPEFEPEELPLSAMK